MTGYVRPASLAEAVAARAALGILQGLIYPAGRPQQLAQATLRVIIVRIALAEALADPALA